MVIMDDKKKKLVPDLRFGEFEGEWEKKKLLNLSNLITKGTTPKKFSSSGVNYIKIEGLVGLNINKEKCLYIDENVHRKELKRSILKENDILFAIAGATVGKIGIVTEDILPANTNQALAIIRLKNAEYLNYILQILQSSVMKKYIYQNVSVGAQPNLNLEQIGNFTFYSPTLPEQQKIANFLSSVDKKIEQLRQKVSLLEDYKKGVMQQIFSQQIRFKDDNGEAFADWEVKKLGEISTFSKGKSLSKSDILETGKYDCIRYGELYTYYKEKIEYIKSKTNLEGKGLIYSEYNDVIIPASGETSIDIATASCVLKEGVILGGDLNIIKSKMNGVFLAYYLNSAKKYSIARLAQGISVTHLYSSQLKTLKLFIPTDKEQQKIANYLSSLDDKIQQSQQQLEKTKQFKKGLLQQLFV